MVGEWKILSLREASVTLIDCDHRTPTPVDSGYPYIAIPQIKEGRVDLKNVRKISKENYLLWTRKAKPQEDDVILSRRCNPGETAYVPSGLECALGQNLVLLRSTGHKVFPPFLRWLVRSPDWWIQVGNHINVGAIFDSLKCADIPNFKLPIPPLPEQKAIADILGTLDDKIELNRKMNETLEEMARSIFKSWFVDFDPVIAKSEGRQPEGMGAESAKLFPDSFVDSEIGRIPKGWKVSSLRSICKNIYSGGTPRTENPAYWGGDIPWLSSGETRNRFIVATEKFITEEGVANSSTRLAHKGCSVIASAGQGHTRGQTSLLTFDCYVNQSVVVLAADKKAVSDCYLFFNLERRYEQFRQLSDSHSSRGSLTTKLLADLQTVVPPKHLVDCFDSWVAPIVLKISDNIHQSIILSIIRDSLLPRLLSGEVRAIDGKRIGGKHAVAM